MIIGQLRPMEMKQPEEGEKKPEEKAPEAVRSPSTEAFLKSPEAKDFIKSMAEKVPLTKRGITSLLGSLHRNSNMSDKEAMGEAKNLLLQLGGRDGFSQALNNLKAKSEGIVKALKSVMGG